MSCRDCDPLLSSFLVESCGLDRFIASFGRRPKGNKLFGVCSFILVVEMCERLCYYTLQGSQRNFLEDAGGKGAVESIRSRGHVSLIWRTLRSHKSLL